MRIVVTGATGFIGRNLCLRLKEAGHEPLGVTRESTRQDILAQLARADAIVHLAGVNRAESSRVFEDGNAGFTESLCRWIAAESPKVPVIASSSIQAGNDTTYGQSKLTAEHHLAALQAETGQPVAICRLVNVFGKWSRPNYNSVVATFCHNIARDLPIHISDPMAKLHLVHVDDVIDDWLTFMISPRGGLTWLDAGAVYCTTLGELAVKIQSFRAIREHHTVGDVGTGLGRALYSTYVSFLPPDAFSYPLMVHGDERGRFVEMLRTQSSGQFSYFTAKPGVTRGGHYHHAKTEKFLVLQGKARFDFRNIDTDETHVIETSGDHPEVVDTVPGWLHDITNVGDIELIVMLWANELFDRDHPDTIQARVLS